MKIIGLDNARRILSDWNNAIRVFGEEIQIDEESHPIFVHSPASLFGMLRRGCSAQEKPYVEWFRDEVVIPIWNEVSKSIDAGGYLVQDKVHTRLLARIKGEEETGRQFQSSINTYYQILCCLFDLQKELGSDEVINTRNLGEHSIAAQWGVAFSQGRSTIGPFASIELTEAMRTSLGLSKVEKDYHSKYKPFIRFRSGTTTWGQAGDMVYRSLQAAFDDFSSMQEELGVLIFRHNLLNVALAHYENYGSIASAWDDDFAIVVKSGLSERDFRLSISREGLTYFTIAHTMAVKNELPTGGRGTPTQSAFFEGIADVASEILGAKRTGDAVLKSAQTYGWHKPGMTVYELVELIKQRAGEVPQLLLLDMKRKYSTKLE